MEAEAGGGGQNSDELCMPSAYGACITLPAIPQQQLQQPTSSEPLMSQSLHKSPSTAKHLVGGRKQKRVPVGKEGYASLRTIQATLLLVLPARGSLPVLYFTSNTLLMPPTLLHAAHPTAPPPFHALQEYLQRLASSKKAAAELETAAALKEKASATAV